MYKGNKHTITAYQAKLIKKTHACRMQVFLNKQIKIVLSYCNLLQARARKFTP